MRRDCLLGVMIHHIMFLLFFGIDFFFFLEWSASKRNNHHYYIPHRFWIRDFRMPLSDDEE